MKILMHSLLVTDKLTAEPGQVIDLPHDQAVQLVNDGYASTLDDENPRRRHPRTEAASEPAAEPEATEAAPDAAPEDVPEPEAAKPPPKPRQRRGPQPPPKTSRPRRK